MTLEQFLVAVYRPILEYPEMSRISTMQRNAYVKERGFINLYVRISHRYIDGKVRGPVLDIANVETRVKGRGTFTKLLVRLRKKRPELPIFIENVLSERFAKGLEKRGLINMGPEITPCFYLPPRKKLTL